MSISEEKAAMKMSAALKGEIRETEWESERAKLNSGAEIKGPPHWEQATKKGRPTGYRQSKAAASA